MKLAAKKPVISAKSKSTNSEKKISLVNYTTQAEFMENYVIEKECCSICGFGLNRKFENLKGKYVYHECSHRICLSCIQRILKSQVKAKVRKPFCPICMREYPQNELMNIHPQLNSEIEEILTQELLQDELTTCRFCLNKFLFAPVNPNDVNPVFEDRVLTKEQVLCTAENNMCCNSCRISTCRKCQSVPYHYGMTCQEYKWFVEGYVCRICGKFADPSSAPNGEIALLTCNNPQCQKTSELMCKEVHLCGHACIGCSCNDCHPLCPICTDGGSLCPHCGKELWGQLSLRLPCGHTIHRACAVSIIKRQRTGPELKLPLCPAPGCGQFIYHKDLFAEAGPEMEEWKLLEEDINLVALGRIEAEGIRHHPDVSSKLSAYAWSSDPALHWAKKNLRFMICRRHLHPCIFTDGRLEDPPYDQSVVCPKCKSYPFPTCDVDGYLYISFKCENCCSIGVRKVPFEEKHRFRRYGWLCEICYSTPGNQKTLATEKCKGNCKFSPHNDTHEVTYGICSKCNSVYKKEKPGFGH